MNADNPAGSREMWLDTFLTLPASSEVWGTVNGQTWFRKIGPDLWFRIQLHSKQGHITSWTGKPTTLQRVVGFLRPWVQKNNPNPNSTGLLCNKEPYLPNSWRSWENRQDCFLSASLWFEVSQAIEKITNSTIEPQEEIEKKPISSVEIAHFLSIGNWVQCQQGPPFWIRKDPETQWLQTINLKGEIVGGEIGPSSWSIEDIKSDFFTIPQPLKKKDPVSTQGTRYRKAFAALREGKWIRPKGAEFWLSKNTKTGQMVWLTEKGIPFCEERNCSWPLSGIMPLEFEIRDPFSGGQVFSNLMAASLEKAIYWYATLDSSNYYRVTFEGGSFIFSKWDKRLNTWLAEFSYPAALFQEPIWFRYSDWLEAIYIHE